MHHQRRRGHARQRVGAAAIGHHGDHLPQDADRIKTATGGRSHHVPQRSIRYRETRAADGLEHAHRMVNRRVQPFAGGPTQQHARDLRAGFGQAARAARTHDAAQAEHPAGCQQRQPLRNHAAHADADDMRLVNLQRIEHTERVGGHVVQAVRRLDAPAEPVFQARPEHFGLAQCVKFLAQSGIAVVKTNHPITGVQQRLHQPGRPGNQLHAQPHDEQHDRTRPALRIWPRAAVLDFDINAICSYFHSYLRRWIVRYKAISLLNRCFSCFVFRRTARAGIPAGLALKRQPQSHSLRPQTL